VNKSSTLLQLENLLQSAKVLPQVQFKFNDLMDEDKVHKLVEVRLKGQERFVVRSSFSGEDTSIASQAGKYLSVVDVGQDSLLESIRRVFDSYPKIASDEIVFIQPYLQNTIRSGVVFTNHPYSGKPYLIDNYVLDSNTESITSGASHGFKHVCLTDPFNDCKDSVCMGLKKVIGECRQILGYDYMDIEYAQAIDKTLYIFQVRPLIIQNKTLVNLTELLASSREFVENKSKKLPFLAGDTTIFGVMPDWNPAEMIGRRPKRLALSLYRELITDSIWAYQRDNYGYKSLRSFPLLVEIGNQPFIDTRVSFNSLLPKGLPEDLENALVNYYLSKLNENRNLHDKIEFEIVLSSWTFDIDRRLSQLPLQISNLQKEFLKKKLTCLTRNVVLGDFVDSDIDRVQKMIQRKNMINTEKREREGGVGGSLSELYWLIEDCKRWGTLPFAGLARAAFIATQVLKSLETVTGHQDVLTNFIGSLDTITSQMSRDVKSLNKDSFLDKYGHLRPGTYDISSLSYREAFDVYFGELMRQEDVFDHKKDDYRELEILLEEYGILEQLGVCASDFINFARKAIYWREQAKFEFTKNLSRALDLIQTIGATLNIDREMLAFLDVRVLMNAYSSAFNLMQEMLNSIEKGKINHHQATVIELPSVIGDVSEVLSFTEEDASPNYITNRSIAGIPNYTLENLAGNIALIEGADPGYDWIFQREIKGLITAYGGANSHMAVRCSELNMPAAIGVGDRLFKEIKGAFHVNLDCGNRIIEYR
jgi:hypothetical protein